MQRFFGMTAEYDAVMDADRWNEVIKTMWRSLHFVWSQVPMNQKLKRARAEVDVFIAQLLLKVHCPPNWMDPWKVDDPRLDPYVYFSPFADRVVFDFPDDFGSFFGKTWKTEITIKADHRFATFGENLEEQEPEILELLERRGLAGVEPPRFYEAEVPFETAMQREVYESLIASFDNHQFCSHDDYWKFNSRALAYICSSVAACFPLKSYEPLGPD